MGNLGNPVAPAQNLNGSTRARSSSNCTRRPPELGAAAREKVTPEFEGVIAMGLYKLCDHRDRVRDRCEHVWWARFRHVRVSLNKWANRDIRTKTEAEAVYDDLRHAVRA